MQVLQSLNTEINIYSTIVLLNSIPVIQAATVDLCALFSLIDRAPGHTRCSPLKVLRGNECWEGVWRRYNSGRRADRITTYPATQYSP